jgi:hypothetical protein
MSTQVLFDLGTGRFLDGETWPEERKLDHVVLKYPELVSRLISESGSDDAIVSLAGSAIGPQLLKIDALFLLDDGTAPPRLVVWENKRQGNVHPRTIVGQVIDYAAALAEITEDRFRAELEQRLNSPAWHDVMAAFELRTSANSRKPLEIIQSAAWAHRDGRYTLVICAENLPDDVTRMARWLDGKLQELGTGGTCVRCAEVAPISDKQWARAAALLEIVGTDSTDAHEDRLDRQFEEAVNRFERLSGSRVTTIDASLAGTSAIALSTDGFAVPTSPSQPISKIPREKWLADAKEPMRAVYTTLEKDVPAEIAAWSGGTRALLLGLHVGDRVVAGLRLFADHFYFVSEKDLINLGLEEVARWWRESLVQFPIESVSAKQPVVRGKAVEKVLSHGDALVRFLVELRTRALKVFTRRTKASQANKGVRIILSEISPDPSRLVFAPVPFSFRQGVIAVAKGGSGTRRGPVCGNWWRMRGVQMPVCSEGPPVSSHWSKISFERMQDAFGRSNVSFVRRPDPFDRCNCSFERRQFSFDRIHDSFERIQ